MTFIIAFCATPAIFFPAILVSKSRRIVWLILLINAINAAATISSTTARSTAMIITTTITAKALIYHMRRQLDNTTLVH